ncbi:MAG: hypothetical protein A3F31_03795 [Candidatus Levybacteria bacterium RIFCSPHIGHO2_12_FULL_38_12]|nr:MAG: hypothetical protein A2770_02190 [Candidatus Levybacteria bacterium RIFCSPHIGHO2_01_FULL_38_12]OGH21888.1 MAG: hypothetical protein A3D75_00410 [Candidatus Levybacteria bacterium RIFCSPHIGHO2_02_FULL_37_18]OGH22820.1 MAG: hypothetical protein A3F31_03795 [Candidatus Levybacteria bacterium RIFCSPHIGHO2_12_FULL_38_12]OGH33545.1 MAG: hypothetical protein A3A47_01755 [Candidatus Levybacteria bacterium RIFCSPLOWO2_01_FULL_37_20]OGH44466.1 MAG: hypothetical protein A3J14_03445 [Candidatus Lev
MREFLHHLLFPRESNNHRSKLLHHQSLLFAIAFFLIAGVSVHIFKTQYASVLGIATNISVQQLLALTNKEREKAGVGTVVLNEELSKAAAKKASDMFSKNYWAHNSPDGKTPWYFIKGQGYEYVYAGENLARGFGTSEEVVKAWMASPSHKENLISSYYKDIGFAVIEGKLLGENTTLVVQEFGNKTLIAKETKTSEVVQLPRQENQVAGKQAIVSEPSVIHIPLLDSFSISRNISVGVIGLFVFIFIIDMIIVARKNIVRLVGHNVDHIFFLGGMLILMFIFSKGIIL